MAVAALLAASGAACAQAPADRQEGLGEITGPVAEYADRQVRAIVLRRPLENGTHGQLDATLETMIAVGTGKITQHGNAWPLDIADGSQSVHYEADILITEDGPRNLTKGLEKLPDVVTR